MTNNYLDDKNILAIYMYGSHVYNTNNENSDKDLIIVVDNKEQYKADDFKEYEVSLYSKEEFIEMINNHQISALECLFLDETKKIKDYQWNFTLNIPVLRSSISQNSSNSWVKAKKKLTIEKDYNPYVGKKSAWHSIRMLEFGIQIAQHGKIINYEISNELLPIIMSCNTWEDINTKFKELYNKTSSKFKEFAPKEIIKIKF